MVFKRSSVPFRKRYKSYREQLRIDFEHKCAYCLRAEGHFGGVGNGEIDHLCPQSVNSALTNDYNNLYWSCSECNGIKGETWPTPDERAKGIRYVDPCIEDHDKHIDFSDNGEISGRTIIGRWTIQAIGLDREILNNHRQDMFETRQLLAEVEGELAAGGHQPEQIQLLQQLLVRLKEKVEPPFFPPYKRRTRKQLLSIT